MENIITNLINNFDFAYMFAINILTYIIIKTIDSFNGTRKVKTYIKRICLLISILIITILYKYNGYDNDIILINSLALENFICFPLPKKSLKKSK